MNQFAISAAAALALATVPAIAQAQQGAAPAPAPASIEVGTTVYGSDENPIGTVIAAEGDAVLVDTSTNQIPLPAAVFAPGEQGPTLNITKANLDAEFEKQRAELAAKLDAALVVGAEVKTADAQPLGAVQAIENDNVVLEFNSEPLTMPKEYFVVDQTGAPVVRATLAQIEEAVAAAPSGS